MIDLKTFHSILNNHCLGKPLSRQDTDEAFHNLTGFMSLLFKINERTKIVSMAKSGAGHDK